MQSRGKFFDDISQLMTNAMGVAQGARGEAETAMKSMIDRWLADRDFVTREEFDAVRAMAQKAREENHELKSRLDNMEKKLHGTCLGRFKCHGFHKILRTYPNHPDEEDKSDAVSFAIELLERCMNEENMKTGHIQQ